MTTSELRRCHDEVSALISAIEDAARAFGDAVASWPPAARSELLVPLQENDATVQRCAHCRDALALLADSEPSSELIAAGCQLQALQLAAAAAHFRAAVTAFLGAAPKASAAGVAAVRLQNAEQRLAGITAALTELARTAPPAPETAAALRAAVLARLNPTYTMADERAILARFLADATAPIAAAPIVPDDIDSYFL